MQSSLLKHLHNSNILRREQYGLRMKWITENAIYKLMDEILTALNNKIIIGGIFCDLEKAFNCVNHDRLISN